MKLYRVDLARTMLVLAEDPDVAGQIAIEFEHDDVMVASGDVVGTTEVMNAAQLPDDWRVSVPWGAEDGNHTCEWYVQNRDAPPVIDTRSGDMFAGNGERA